MTNIMPKAAQHLFWDVDVDNLKQNKHKRFIIERILEKGDIKTIAWLLKLYPLAVINKIIYTPVNLSANTIYFWRQYIEQFA